MDLSKVCLLVHTQHMQFKRQPQHFKKCILFECQCIQHESTNKGHYFLHLLLKTGPPFYVVIRTTRRSSRLQCKGSTFISQLFQDPEYWSGPGNRTRDFPFRCRMLYRSTELTLPLKSGLYIRCKETGLPLGSVLSTCNHDGVGIKNVTYKKH